MKKLFLSILIIILYINSNAQSPLRINKYLVDSLTGSGYWYLFKDTTHTGQWGLVNGGSGGGGGSGTVTNVAGGFAILGGPITTTGTLRVDTTSGGVTSWRRTKKVIDSLSSAGWATNIYNSDGTLTGDRTVTMGSHILTFLTAGGSGNYYEFGGSADPHVLLSVSGGNSYFQLDDSYIAFQSYLNNSVNITDNGSGGDPDISFFNGNQELRMRGDSTQFKPFLGRINIDSLRTGTSADQIMTWNAGMVRKITYLDTTFYQTKAATKKTTDSVVALIGGGGTTWNGITDPTGDQALTFGAGESTTWTDQNTTEDLFTVNNATSTTNSLFSYNRTSTALAAGNNIMEIISSGANGTNAITATGLSISVTNTNGTSGTNKALVLAASGATTLNTALEVTSGRVGINETSPQTILQVGEDGGVVSTFGTGAQMLFTNNGSATYITGIKGTAEIYMGVETNNGIVGMLSADPLTFRTSNSARITISSGGTVTINDLAGTGSRAVVADASGVLSAPVSDRTVKKNINSLDYGLDEIMQLIPVSFEYKDDWKNYGRGKQIGFIAQDVQRVLPNSVFTTPTTGKMGYNEIDLVPVLVKAVQEQQEEIESLKKEIKKLKRK